MTEATLFPEQPKHDPGGKVRLALQEGVTGDAEFSECGRYRHWLSRRWDGRIARLSDHGWSPYSYALWIGMNPSTAEAHVDDPTIRREINFTRMWDLAGYIKCNVLDYRATSTKRLLEPGVVPASPRNIPTILRFAPHAYRIIVCYGVLPPKLQSYAEDVVQLLEGAGHELWCLGLSRDGCFPKHPLYLKSDTPLIPFERRAR